jgi:hypothetical protein
MLNQNKRIRELALKLNSNSDLTISEAIEALRNEKPFHGAIGLLTTHYDKTADPMVRELIKNFLNDLKEQAIREEVVSEMKKPYKDDTIKMLVSSCWQSGLDYSDYGMDLADIFLKGSYVTAIECLTAIEESLHLMSQGKKNQIIEFIKNNTGTEVTDKTVLTWELLAILK